MDEYHEAHLLRILEKRRRRGVLGVFDRADPGDAIGGQPHRQRRGSSTAATQTLPSRGVQTSSPALDELLAASDAGGEGRRPAATRSPRVVAAGAAPPPTTDWRQRRGSAAYAPTSPDRAAVRYPSPGRVPSLLYSPTRERPAALRSPRLGSSAPWAAESAAPLPPPLPPSPSYGRGGAGWSSAWGGTDGGRRSPLRRWSPAWGGSPQRTQSAWRAPSSYFPRGDSRGGAERPSLHYGREGWGGPFSGGFADPWEGHITHNRSHNRHRPGGGSISSSNYRDEGRGRRKSRSRSRSPGKRRKDRRHRDGYDDDDEESILSHGDSISGSSDGSDYDARGGRRGHRKDPHRSTRRGGGSDRSPNRKSKKKRDKKNRKRRESQQQQQPLPFPVAGQQGGVGDGRRPAGSIIPVVPAATAASAASASMLGGSSPGAHNPRAPSAFSATRTNVSQSAQLNPDRQDGLPDVRSTIDLRTSAQVLQAGDWFYKWNRSGSEVHPRWVWIDLRSYLLVWSARETRSPTFSGSIKLENISQVAPSELVQADDEGLPKTYYVLMIQTPNRTLQLATERKTKMNVWFEALNNVVAFVRRRDILKGTQIPD